MRFAAYIIIAETLVIAGCAAPGPPSPSLAPRAAEQIDPRLPVLPAGPVPPLSQAVSAQLAALIRQARSGDTQFGPAIAEAERRAAAAGASRSESWIVAQEALSAASAARGDTTRALAEIDAIGAQALASKGSIGPADLAAIQAAAREVGQIDNRQASQLTAVSRRLGL
ncbi:MAG: hypothetical protein ACJ8EY_10875 [Sphingomicrobium sp.]